MFKIIPVLIVQRNGPTLVLSLAEKELELEVSRMKTELEKVKFHSNIYRAEALVKPEENKVSAILDLNSENWFLDSFSKETYQHIHQGEWDIEHSFPVKFHDHEFYVTTSVRRVSDPLGQNRLRVLYYVNTKRIFKIYIVARIAFDISLYDLLDGIFASCRANRTLSNKKGIEEDIFHLLGDGSRQLAEVEIE